MKKIFVIGNIGSGKSTFCEYLGAALADRSQTVVINLDKLGHHALKNSEVRAAIKAAFGPIRSRVELANVAFSDAGNLNRLNQITHPFILQDLRLRLQEAEQAGLQFVVVEQTAVAEKDDEFLELADTIVCVVSPKIYSETPNRVNAQLSQKQLQGFADIVVANDDDLIALKENACHVAKKIAGPVDAKSVQADLRHIATKTGDSFKQNSEEK